MNRITITQAPVLLLPRVNRLFRHAVETHFTYFPAAVQQRVILEHSVARLLRAALDPRRVVLVAKSGRQLVGYCLGAAPTSGPAQVYWLYVDPDYRGNNIGLTLLSRMLKLLADKGAGEVSIATHDHRRYYERQGFKFKQNTMVDGVPMDVLTFKVSA